MTAGNTDVPDHLTRRLVDEAARMLTERGRDGLSLRKVAEAAGTSTMAVYTRFGGKQELLAAMYREGFRRLGAVLSEAAEGGEPVTALADIGRGYRRAALASRDLYGLMFGPPTPRFEPSAEDAAAAAATYGPLLEGVRRCVEAELMAGDPERIALHLWAVVHGMVSLELAGRLPSEDGEQAFEEALVLAAEPFLVTGAPPRPQDSARG